MIPTHNLLLFFIKGVRGSIEVLKEYPTKEYRGTPNNIPEYLRQKHHYNPG